MAIRPGPPSVLFPTLALAFVGATTAPAVNLPHEESGAQGRGTPGESRPAPRLPESTLRAPAYRLWEASGFGNEKGERAAWVVEDGAREAGWLGWPNARGYLRARWEGPIPPSVVAIVHTHPAVVDPKPSEQDIETARRLGVPVYTVSRSGIWKAVPEGSVVRVDDARWWSGCRSGACDATRDPDFRSARGFSDPRNLGEESAYP